MTNSEELAAAPSPLGWCAWHLDEGQDVPAETLRDGDALCRDCNAQRNEVIEANVVQAQSMMEDLDRLRPRRPSPPLS